MSVFSNSLQRQMDAAFADLERQPNDLLLRCVQRSAGTRRDLELSTQESKYLEEKGIAKIYINLDHDGDRFGPDRVSSFLSPWKEIFADLAIELKAYRPGKKKKIIAETEFAL